MTQTLKNLLSSWEKLAPDELKIKDGEEYVLAKTYDWDFYPEIVSIYNSFLEEPYSKDMLQGYIQRCIEDRGWFWTCGQQGDFDGSYYAEIWIDGAKQEAKIMATPYEALMAAYLTAIAEQRPIEPGQWQHFKGGFVEVLGEAHWDIGQYSGKLGEQYLPFAEADLLSCYQMEEEPSKILDLYRNENEFFYISKYASDHANRVFYSHNGKGWARKTDIFLGIVGAEHSKSEGLLRFVEVANDTTST
jgi:hypothetical protein